MWGPSKERNHRKSVLWPYAPIWRPYITTTTISVQKTVLLLVGGPTELALSCTCKNKMKWLVSTAAGEPLAFVWLILNRRLLQPTLLAWWSGVVGGKGSDSLVSMVVCHLCGSRVVKQVSLPFHQVYGWVLLECLPVQKSCQSTKMTKYFSASWMITFSKAECIIDSSSCTCQELFKQIVQTVSNRTWHFSLLTRIKCWQVRFLQKTEMCLKHLCIRSCSHFMFLTKRSLRVLYEWCWSYKPLTVVQNMSQH